MKMKLEELVAGKEDNEKVEVEGNALPVLALKNLMKDGYVFLKPYKENNTYSVWGKNCTACFTPEEIAERA
ncbi:MAG: hypothetical protein DRH11_13685 [Deltaproteobacteria bacterium]|nr:MAG: hypothetical protein DRH11_13685 [Deltaproteobacteria bacterium]